ncbi:MAG: PIG-L deacetylase family protein [Sterolibacterium sp.]|jgi:LmbE family N-acetylglucosaminyl deacetylase
MLILTLLAHPDDAELWAGGTLCKHGRRGDDIICLTFFEHMPQRMAECRHAASELGLGEPRFLGTPAYTMPSTDAVLTELDGRVPDVVVTHWHKDTHLEHRLCCELSLALTHHWKRHVKKTPLLLMCSTYFMRGLASFDPDVIIDIDEVVAVKEKAVRAYASQKVEHLLGDVDAQAALLGARIGCRRAEGFIEYPLFGHTRTRERPHLDLA